MALRRGQQAAEFLRRCWEARLAPWSLLAYPLPHNAFVLSHVTLFEVCHGFHDTHTLEFH